MAFLSGRASIANTLETVELGYWPRAKTKPSPLPLSISSSARLTVVADRSALVSHGGMATFPGTGVASSSSTSFSLHFAVATSSKALRPSFNAKMEKKEELLSSMDGTTQKAPRDHD